VVCSAFGRRAEVIGEHLHKGSRVYLEGRKRKESRDDKQSGTKHYRDFFYADRIEFLDSTAHGNTALPHIGNALVIGPSIVAEFRRRLELCTCPTQIHFEGFTGTFQPAA
jgi:single-stranded DNA-binding protein